MVNHRDLLFPCRFYGPCKARWIKEQLKLEYGFACLAIEAYTNSPAVVEQKYFRNSNEVLRLCFLVAEFCNEAIP